MTRTRKSLSRLLCAVAVGVPLACSERASPSVDESVAEAPETPVATHLSEYGLFDDLPGQRASSGVVPYVLNSGHFADYATVRRFIRLPAGQSATYRERDGFELPTGTLIAQTFSYPQEQSSGSTAQRLVETRVLLKRKTGWHVIPYVWNDEGTDARKTVAGALIPIRRIDDTGQVQSFKYHVPNSNDCKRCHQDVDGRVRALGLTARNLDRTIETSDGERAQLEIWRESGRLRGLPTDVSRRPRLPDPQDTSAAPVDARARAWLDVNCSHCHSPAGAGSVSGLDLRFDQDNPVRYGVFKPPVAAGRSSAGRRFSIEPGNPEGSFLIERLRSTDPSIQMPPLGRRLVSQEAVSLISEWIAAMEFDSDASRELQQLQMKEYEEFRQSGVWKR